MSKGEELRAPFAAVSTVRHMLEENRNRPIERFDADALTKLGVAETVIPRTIDALVWLGLVEEDGRPTEAMLRLRRAPTDEYTDLLGQILRAKYSDVFRYWQPGEPTDRLDDLFRAHEPMTMRPRMVRLFLGLAAYAGMIPEADALKRALPERAARPRRTGGSVGTTPPPTRASAHGETKAAKAAPIEIAPGRLRTMEHPHIKGLIETQPPNIGDKLAPEERDAWLNLATATLGVLYPVATAEVKSH
jgi:hypothetical protein